MMGESKHVEKQKGLLLAWNDVQVSVNSLSTELRRIPGCRNAVITICLRNGARMDTFSVPKDIPLPGLETTQRSSQEDLPRSLGSEPLERRSDSQNGIDETIEVIGKMNTKDFRSFLTKVRQRLNLSSFRWPETAKNGFLTTTNDPIPTGPGRANSGMKNLVLMVKLSMECDGAWKKAVKDEMNELNLVSALNSQNTHRRQDRNDDIIELSDVRGVFDSPNNSYDHQDDTDVAEDAHSTIIRRAKMLPLDTMRVNSGKREWVTVSELMSSMSHPRIGYECEWFIQRTPGDGNCMFYSILTAAKNRSPLPTNVQSVGDLRNLLRYHLEHLSRAGKAKSIYRREWLASCLFDVDDKTFRVHSQNAMDNALQSCTTTDIEDFLCPLRIYVGNWAKMVGETHWGGLLRVELAIVAGILGVAIEILQTTTTNSLNTNIQHCLPMCDTRNHNQKVYLERSQLHHPVKSSLPSPEQTFLGPTLNGNTASGWSGPYPVLRILLNRRHYDACTSKSTNPIPKENNSTPYIPTGPCFRMQDTLVEPYEALSRQEMRYYGNAKSVIKNWEDASQRSEEEGRHADAVVFSTRCTELTISSLFRLQVAPPIIIDDSEFMMNDELMTCYMHLLERRADALRSEANRKGVSVPPKCRYLDSWFYKSICRGPTGPASRRQRTDLNSFSLIVIPVLSGNHWVLAVCYAKERAIGVYDPTHCRRDDIFKVINDWAELQLHKTQAEKWRFIELRETGLSAQKGNIDCGVYVCKAAESFGLGLPFRMSQWDVEYVRKRMMVELFRQEASSVRWPRA